MTSNPFNEDAKTLSPRGVDEIVDEESAVNLVRTVFWEIGKRFGEDRTREMFAPYGRKLNNIDRTAQKNAWLIWQLYHMDKPNILELARKLSGKGGKNKNDRESQIEAWRKQIHRALDRRKPEGRRAIAAVKELEDWTGNLVLPESIEHADLMGEFCLNNLHPRRSKS